MARQTRSAWQWMTRTTWQHGLPVLLSSLVGITGTATSQAQELAALPAPITSPAPATSVAALPVTLTDCLLIARQQQPRIAAQRASLAAAEDGSRALEALIVPAVLSPELPIRRKQACLGVTAAVAGLEQAEREAAYAVTRAYLTVLYAREQESVSRSVVERLSATRDAAQRGLDAGARDVSAVDVSRSTVYLKLAETKRIQATQGVARALAALREATGLGPTAHLEVAARRLPAATAVPNRAEVVDLALARRGELVRATIFDQVTCLEIDAQGTTPHRKMETFAAGSDIHAVVVPQEISGTDFRPGALPPEMPTLLVGTRPERMKRAQSFNARAHALVDVTRNLVALEAEDAFLRWEESAQAVAQAKEAAEAGDGMADNLNKDFTAGLRVKVDEVITARVLAAQARAQVNESLYRELLALAELERVTAGGFCAGLTDAAPVRRAALGIAPR